MLKLITVYSRTLSSLRRNWLCLLLCFVPLAVHAPELAGFVNDSPLLQETALTLHPDSGLLAGRPYNDGSAAPETMSLGKLSAESWLHLKLPWWNPFTGVGLPLASNMQPAAFLLPFVLLLHFSQGVLYLKLCMQVLAGLFCFAFLRQIGVTSWAALLGSILFQCNGSFALYTDPSVMPIAFLPLLFLGIERARQHALARRPGGQAVVALAVAYSLLAGFPETAFLNGLLALAWSVLRAGDLGGQARLRMSGKIIVGGIVGLALASPVLLPFLHDLALSTLGPDRAVAAGKAVLPPQSYPLLLFPNFYGPPLGNWSPKTWVWVGGYFGTVAPLLAFLAWPNRTASLGVRTFLTVWSLCGLAAAVNAPIVGPLIRSLPLLNETIISRYGFSSMSFCISILAGLTFDKYMVRGVRMKVVASSVTIFLLAIVALAIGIEELAAGNGSVRGTFWLASVSAFWGVCAPLMLASLLSFPTSMRRRLVITAIVVLEAAGLSEPTVLTGPSDAGFFNAPVDFLQSHAGLQRTVSIGAVLSWNTGAYFGFGLLNYAYSPVPSIWANFVSQTLDPGSMRQQFPNLFEPTLTSAAMIFNHLPQLEAMAVRYVVAPSWINLFGIDLDPSPPFRVFHKGGIDIFMLPAARPYAETQGGPCRLAVADREHMVASCDGPAYLLRRELAFPGWHARVNGRRAGITTAADIFQRIDLPAGRSAIVWRYVPEYANTIALIFAAGVLGLVGTALRPLPWRQVLPRRRLVMPDVP